MLYSDGATVSISQKLVLYVKFDTCFGCQSNNTGDEITYVNLELKSKS